MSSEHRNRTNKAEAIAAALWAAGVNTPADVAALDDVAWRLAARTGWHLADADARGRTEWSDASDETRRMVAQLIEGQAHAEAVEADGLVQHEVDDVFARIAAGSSLPRPVVDPDRAPAVHTGAVALHPAAEHTLNCLAGFNTTGCQC